MEQLTAQVTFRLSKDTLDAAKKIAEKEDRKVAHVLRRIVEKALGRKQ